MGEELLLPGLGGAAAGAAGATAMAAQQATNQAIANSIDAAVDALRDKLQIKFVTYTRTGPNGQVYSGRTSGLGDPQSIANTRARTHDPRLAGFGPPAVDEWATGIQGRAAIRGREQQLIDHFGGAQSEGGTSANLIRGVSRSNPFGGYYNATATTMFGPLPPRP